MIKILIALLLLDLSAHAIYRADAIWYEDQPQAPKAKKVTKVCWKEGENYVCNPASDPCARDE